jgi:hypothetical protein
MRSHTQAVRWWLDVDLSDIWNDALFKRGAETQSASRPRRRRGVWHV